MNTHFLVDEGKADQKTTINRPSSARQRNAISMAFRWRAYDGQTLNAGLVAVIFYGIWTSIAKKPYIFVIFQSVGGVRTPCPPSGSAHVQNGQTVGTIL